MKKFLIILFGLLITYGCEEVFEVDDITAEQVQLLAPTSGTTVTDSIVRFNWESVLYANAYEVQVATPNFDNAIQIVLDTLLVVDSTYVGNRIIKTLQDSEYEWRVRASNSGYQTPFTKASFTVDKP